ncbi:ras-related protein Rab-44 [Lissotriton helveticus]
MSGKARKLGSTRRRTGRPSRDPEDGSRAITTLDEEPLASDIMQRVQEFFQECDVDDKGFITREDMQKANSNFLCSPEELEILFDGLDYDRKGYLTTEEFTTGLRNFVDSQEKNAEQRRKRLSSKRMSAPPMMLSPEEADDEERQHFMSFMEHLGANNIFEDESEIWKLWAKLRHDEPYLLGNLEEFLAKVTNQIKEARKEKETLELTLKKRIAEHNEEVQQLYEEMEQQIKKEKERLRTESDARSNFQSKEMKKTLDFKENDIQHLVVVQNELETQLHKLRSKQQVTTTENENLKRTNQDLEVHLDRIREQLVEAQNRIQVMRNKASQQQNKELREQKISEDSKKVYDTQHIPHDEYPATREMDSTSALQLRTMNAPSDRDQDTSQNITADFSESEVHARSRVISIEEDPLPEYLTKEPVPLRSDLPAQVQNEFDQSSVEKQKSNMYEPHWHQQSDPVRSPEHWNEASMHDKPSEHDTSLDMGGSVHDMFEEAHRHAGEEPSALGDSALNRTSEQGRNHEKLEEETVAETEPYVFKKVQSQRNWEFHVNSEGQPSSELRQKDSSEEALKGMVEHNPIPHEQDDSAPLIENVLIHTIDEHTLYQDTHKHANEEIKGFGNGDHKMASEKGENHGRLEEPLVEVAEPYIFKKVQLQRNWEVAIDPAAQPISELRQNETPEEVLTEIVQINPITHEEDHSWTQIEKALVHNEGQVDSEEEMREDRVIQAMPNTYTLVWDIEPSAVCEQAELQAKYEDVPEENTSISQVSLIEQEIRQTHMAQAMALETPVSSIKGKKRVTFTTSVLERLAKAGVENMDEHDENEDPDMYGDRQEDFIESTKAKQSNTKNLENRPLDNKGSAANLSAQKAPLALHTMQNPDFVYKVLFIGNSSVGKSSFLYRVHDGIFRPEINATIGLDYRIKTLIVDNKRFALQMWDTAGQERYHSITKQFFRKADGIVLMYDVTSAHSFTAVRYWLDCIKESVGDSVLILLLGNKIDCASGRQVSTNEGKQLAQMNRLLFHECSAAADLNISLSIIHLARALKEHEDRLKNNVVAIPSQTVKKQNCCT